MDALVTRATDPSQEAEREMEETERLRGELRSLKEEREKEILNLKKEIQDLREMIGRPGVGTPEAPPGSSHPRNYEEATPCAPPHVGGAQESIERRGVVGGGMDVSPSHPAPPEPKETEVSRPPITEDAIAKIIDDRLKSLPLLIGAKVQKTFLGLKGQMAAPQKGAAEERPLPKKRGKKGKQNRAPVPAPPTKGRAAAGGQGAQKQPPPKKGKPAPPKRRGRRLPPLPNREQGGKGDEGSGLVAQEPADGEGQWSKIVGREARKEVDKAVKPAMLKPAATTSKGAKKAPRRGAPRTAAVVLSCPKGEYAAAMSKVRGEVKLGDLGIQAAGLRTRTGITGALIIEVPARIMPPRQMHWRLK